MEEIQKFNDLNPNETPLTFERAIKLRNSEDIYVDHNSKKMLLQRYTDELRFLQQDYQAVHSNINWLQNELFKNYHELTWVEQIQVKKAFIPFQESLAQLQECGINESIDNT